MRTRTSWAMAGAVAAAGLLALTATAGHTGDTLKGPPDAPLPGGPRPPAFADIDTNHDGAISQAEFDTFHEAHAPKGPPLDGPSHHHGHKGGHRPDFKSLDANSDGKVTLDEFEAPLKGRFARLDANHDGALDASELEKDGPMPPPGEGPLPAR